MAPPSWVMHMTEEVWQWVCQKQICSWSSRKPDRQEKSTFCSTAPGRRLPATVAPLPACPRTVVLRLALCPSLTIVRQISACHCSSPSGLPTNCDAPFSILFESLVSLSVHVRAYLCSPAYPQKPWEQKEFDGNCLGTCKNKKIIDGLLVGTRWIWWQLPGNLIGTERIWWEFSEYLMWTKGIWWELDGNKRNLFGTWWEDEFDENFLGIWWEQKEFE